jgi:quercetin dioxygenase-like cupin family protein
MMPDTAATSPLIQHRDALPAYTPPAHHGTVNRRLVAREAGAGFEMVHGTLAPGGEASRHYHATETQVFYIVAGAADVALGEAPAERCGPGTVIRVPPGVVHEVVAVGAVPLEVIVLYCPPAGRSPGSASST